MKRRLFLSVVIFLGVFFFSKNNVFAAGPTIVESDITVPTTWTRDGSPYIVLNTVYAKSSLTIEPGAVVKFKNNGSSLMIQGTFSAVGTPLERIIFTSVCDNNYGGDTKNYGYFYCYNGSLKGQWGWISIYDNVNTVKIKHAKISYAGRGLSYQAYNYNVAYQGLVSIENTEIRYSNSGIYIRNAIPLMRSLILSDNDIGLEVTTSYSDRVPKVSNSTIANNGIGIKSILSGVSGAMPTDASDNWWGDASGPYFYHTNPQKANLQGKGNEITGDGIIFRPWLETEPNFDDVSCIDNCFSNVLFLPGVEASRLYSKDDPNCSLINCENQLWEPNRNDDVRALFLNTDGKGTGAFNIYTKENGIIDELNVSGMNIYKSFVDTMDKMKNDDHLINDWKPAPYDWRLSYDDIVNNGILVDGTLSYDENSSSPYILTELKRLAESSRTGKVTLVAHSNGGLVAKKLMETLGDVETARLIDRVILVAVPQVGTPMSIPAMLNGFDQDHVAGLITSKKTARELAEYMPGAYQLLPSQKYFTTVTTPVVTFDPVKLPDWTATYGENISSFDTLQTFLSDTTNRVSGGDSDMETPSILHQNLLNQARGEHQALDEWRAPAGVEVIEIAGWGVPATVDGAHYDTEKKYTCDKGSGLCSTGADVMRATPHFTIDGDGTVVTPSALWMNTDDGATRYWTNLQGYNNEHRIRTVFGALNIEHSKIFEVPQINNFIVDIVTHSVKPLSDYAYLSTEAPISTGKRLEYVLHSPLTLDLYDDEGHHTGISPTTGQIEEQIPGTYYRQFGEVKYIFSDEFIPTHLTLDGYDTGRFTLEVKQLQGDMMLDQMTFQDMPTTDNTKVFLDVPTDLSSASPLRIDRDGNGTDDFVIQSQIGSPIVFDTTPPVTETSLTGTSGTNDWYTGDVIVTFTAQDPETGIDHISYSLDDGATWNTYMEPVMIAREGTTTVQYFSTNAQGSEELIQAKTIKIDKSAPEISFSFDAVAKELDIIGKDALSVVKMDISTTSVTGTDEAGHAAVVTFAKNENGKQIKFEIRSLAYDGVSASVLPVTLNYEWSLEKTGDVKMLNEMAMVGKMQIQAHYLTKDNTTVITKTADSVVTSEIKPGLSVFRLVTENGVIKINY